MPADYTIEVWGDSVRVSGGVPCRDLNAITMLGKVNGYDIIDLYLARHYHVSMFITSKALSMQLQREIHAGDLPRNGVDTLQDG
jgi:predicted nucleic acid-binding Zn finger protein